MVKSFIFQFICVCTLLAILSAQTISISPEFSYKYESDSEQYSTENLPIQDYELSIVGQYTTGKLNILTRMGCHLIDGINEGPSDFTREQGLHWFRHHPGLENDQKLFYVADMKLKYGDSTVYFYFNKWDKHLGPGVNSLIISNKIPSFFHFGFKWQLAENIHFEHFHGTLKSGITDSTYSKYYAGRPIDMARNIVVHRVEWQPIKQIILSGSESVLYTNRFIEMAYLLPFVPLFFIQTYIGETDNSFISGDIQFLPYNNISLYGVLFVDDWTPPNTFQTRNNNKFGYQIGIDWNNIYLNEDRFRLEYTWADHRIYHHEVEINDYYSWDYPVGFWAGPHSEEIYMDYSFTIGENRIQLLLSNAKRGEYTDSMRVYYYGIPPDDVPMYKRFGKDNLERCKDCVGTVEFKQLIRLSVKRQLMKKVDISLQYTYVDWKNAGFIPSDPLPEETLSDIIKFSLGIGLQYRY